MSTVQSSRRLAVIIGFLLSFGFISLVYAFVQRAEAKRQEQIALLQMERAMQMKNELESCREAMASQDLKSAK